MLLITSIAIPKVLMLPYTLLWVTENITADNLKIRAEKFKFPSLLP